MNPATIYAWEVYVSGTDWRMTVNARTRGQANRVYHNAVLDPYPNMPFTALRCRKLGPPHTSEGFAVNAAYRGKPGVKCGDRVRVGTDLGTIVGHNPSANFDVLFDADSKYHGARLNVHPDSCELVENQHV